MALTRPKIWDLDTNIEYFKDPLTTLHQGATLANVDVGFVFNRANGLVSNVALYWSESANSFITSFTTSSGTTDTNVTITSYANVTTGHHLPGANVTYNLGSPTQRWGTLYLAGNTIDMAGATIGAINGVMTLTNQSGGSFTVSGSAPGQSTGTFGNIIANSGIASTSTTSGALQVIGGTGISGNLYVGGNLVVAGTQTFLSTETVTTTEYVNTINATNLYSSTIGNAGATLTGATLSLTNVGDTSANIGIIYNHVNTLDANVGSYEIVTNANIGLVYNHVNTLDSNVGSYENTTNANIGALYLGNISTNANLGVIYNHVNTLDANIGSYEIATNANLGTVVNSITSLYTNANANTSAYLSKTALTIGTTGANTIVGGNLVIVGNLFAQGTLTWFNTETVNTTEYVNTINATNVNATIIGNLGTTLTGSLSTAAQPNVTSLGTLTALNITDVGDVSANIGGHTASINAVNANIGLYENTTNANIGTVYNHVNLLDANVGSYENTTNANIGSIFNSVNTLTANLGLYENTTNANIGTVLNNLQTLTANVGSYENTTNANIGLVYNHVNTLDANVGTYETTTSSTLTSHTTSINNINANVGAYEIANNANIGVIFNHVNTLDANVGAYEIANNANIGTVTTNITTLFSNAAAQQTQIISLYTNANANVAAYLPIYAGSLGGTLTTVSQPNVTTLAGLTSFGLVNTTTTAQGNLTIAGNLNVTGNINTIGNIYNVTITGNSGQFFGNLAGFGALYAGIPTGFSIEPQTTVQVSSNFNGYAQLNMQNINSGSLSSADFIVTANNGNANDTYIDLGMASSAYNYPGFGLLRPNDGYLLVYGNTTTRGGNLVLGAGGGGLDNDIIFAVGGFDNTNEFGRIDGTGNVFIIKSAVPSTSTTSGAVQIAGGIGVQGNINAGGNLSVAGNIVIANGIFWANGNIYGGGNSGTTYTSTGPGNITVVGSTLALTVTGPGAVSVGSSTAIPVITTDAYGRISTTTTAAVVAPAGTLSGTTLASGVTASSLTSVGTLGALTVTATITGSVSGSAATVTAASQPSITTLAGLTSFGTSGVTTTAAGNFTITGCLTVNGTTTTVNNTTVETTEFVQTIDATAIRSATIGNIGANHVGAGTYLTSLNATNLSSGTVPSAQVSGTYTGITQVGTLTSLAVTNATTTGNLITTNGVFWANGVTYSSGSGGSGITYTAATTAPLSPVNGAFWYNSSTDILYQRIFDGTNTEWVDQSTPTTFGTISTGQLAVTNATVTNWSATISNGSLGGTAGNQVLMQKLSSSDANVNSLEITETRTATGTSWTTSATRLQEKIDATWMGFIQFNGDTNNAGITFGTGTSTVGPTSIAERIRIDSGGNMVPAATNTYNLGSATSVWATVYGTTFSGVSTTAKYADLAENYLSDIDYTPGTVVIFGGTKEITVSDISHDTRVAGVISTDPAYLMNSEAVGLPVALTGRVPCYVQGPVAKGDRLVNLQTGIAGKLNKELYEPGCIIGKSLETILDNKIKLIEIAVGRY